MARDDKVIPKTAELQLAVKKSRFLLPSKVSHSAKFAGLITGSAVIALLILGEEDWC